MRRTARHRNSCRIADGRNRPDQYCALPLPLPRRRERTPDDEVLAWMTSEIKAGRHPYQDVFRKWGGYVSEPEFIRFRRVAFERLGMADPKSPRLSENGRKMTKKNKEKTKRPPATDDEVLAILDQLWDEGGSISTTRICKAVSCGPYRAVRLREKWLEMHPHRQLRLTHKPAEYHAPTVDPTPQELSERAKQFKSEPAHRMPMKEKTPPPKPKPDTLEESLWLFRRAWRAIERLA